MLDDLKYIHQRDGQDALGIAERQAGQLEHKFEVPKIEGEFHNIVFAGMGGSALPALLSTSWPGYNVPFEICRQYNIPAYVSDKTLFIAASYSGNTEETLSALAEAEAKGAVIAVFAGGGKLEEIAGQKGYPFVKIPKAEQPRYAVFYMLVALLAILESAGLLKEKEAAGQLAHAAEFLRQSVKDWTATVRTAQNPAKKLALELAGKSGVVYAGPLLAPAAYKWKISFNENAKNVAWWGQYPEFNHNEFIGWSSHPIQKPYSVIDLRSNLEHPRIQKRFGLSDRLLSGQRPAAHVVEVQGQDILEQLVWAVAYGDFVTIYLALCNNVNPAPVDLVEKFKKELG
jgi:glucose/mannose-6-phosphate isomerase